ncbi:MAG: AMP-binding protein, partial [Gammaproteobacteria bacterium]
MPLQPKSYCHRGDNEPLLGATIAEHFADVVTRFGEHEAVVSVPQQKRLSYKDLSAVIDQLARGLLAIGFCKGDRIGVWSTNNIEWLMIQMATARIGAILVNINPAYRLRELAYALQRSEVQGIFTIPAFRSSDYVAMLAELIPELTQSNRDELHSGEFPFLRKVIVYDPTDAAHTRRPHPGFMTWPE